MVTSHGGALALGIEVEAASHTPTGLAVALMLPAMGALWYWRRPVGPVADGKSLLVGLCNSLGVDGWWMDGGEWEYHQNKQQSWGY